MTDLPSVSLSPDQACLVLRPGVQTNNLRLVDAPTIVGPSQQAVIETATGQVGVGPPGPPFLSGLANEGAGAGVFDAVVGTTAQLRSLVGGPGIAAVENATDITLNNTLTAANLGAGAQVFAAKAGATLNMRSIVAGANVTVTQNADDVTIAAAAAGGVTALANEGGGTGLVFDAVVGSTANLRTLQADPTAGNEGALISTAGTVVRVGNTMTGANVGAGPGTVFAAKTGAGALQFNSLAGTANGLTVSAPAAGVVTLDNTLTGANLGAGAQVFSAKAGANLNLRSIVAGSGGVTATQNANDITIDNTLTGANLGAGAQVFSAKAGAALNLRSIVAGANVTVTQNANDITIAADAAALEAGTAGTVSMLDFQSYVPGSRPPFIELVSSTAPPAVPTAIINASRRLETSSIYNQPTRVILHGYTFGEGVLRVAVLKGEFMVKVVNDDLTARAVWSATGANLEVGYLSAAGAPTSLLLTPMVGAPGDIVWVELITGPAAAAVGFRLRQWVDGGQRPAAALSTTWGAGATGMNYGQIELDSITAGPATYAALQLLDGSPASVQVTGQATFIGRWSPRFDYSSAMTTIRGGSQFRFRVSGAAQVSARCNTPTGVVQYPVGDVYVDGAHAGTVTFTTVLSASTPILLASGLDPAATHEVVVRVRGVHEHNPKWDIGCGLMVESLFGAGGPGAAVIAPWPDARPKILFLGDSITEGILARGAPSLPSTSGGDLSWPVLAAEALGLSPVVNGFGGTRLTGPSSGSGGVPEAPVNSVNYMRGRPTGTNAENIKFIVVNLGTNDSSAAVAGATFQTAMAAFITQLVRAFPGVQAMWVMRPFGGQYAAQISAAVAATQDPRVSYLDTSAWAGITYTDGVHPDLAGHATIAGYLVPALGALQQPIAWP